MEPSHSKRYFTRSEKIRQIYKAKFKQKHGEEWWIEGNYNLKPFEPHQNYPLKSYLFPLKSEVFRIRPLSLVLPCLDKTSHYSMFFHSLGFLFHKNPSITYLVHQLSIKNIYPMSCSLAHEKISHSILCLVHYLIYLYNIRDSSLLLFQH